MTQDDLILTVESGDVAECVYCNVLTDVEKMKPVTMCEDGVDVEEYGCIDCIEEAEDNG